MLCTAQLQVGATHRLQCKLYNAVVLDSIRGVRQKGWKKRHEKVTKKREVASRGKEWPVTTLFSNQVVDKYLYCTKEWSCRYVWSCGGRSVGFVTNHTHHPHLIMATLIGFDLEGQSWSARERPLQ